MIQNLHTFLFHAHLNRSSAAHTSVIVHTPLNNIPSHTGERTVCVCEQVGENKDRKELQVKRERGREGESLTEKREG